MQATGDLYGDMFEISNFRKEDIANITDPSGEFVEVLQCHNASKGPQSRGHQYAGAFLYKVLEIKPCGLGSRIRGVCSPKIGLI